MFSSILCPVDPGERGSERAALEKAKAIAQAGGGRIVLLAVVLDPQGTAVDYLPPNFYEDQAKETEAYLEGLAQGLGLPDGRVETKVRFGRPYHEILQEADETGCDLIAMASHRPSFSTYLLGSTATHVVRHAKCSVLAVRPAAA